MNPAPSLKLDPSLAGASLRVALVQATSLTTLKSEVAGPRLAALLAKVRETGEAWLPETRKKAVRDLLRFGGYKPAGRAKPSNEYLLAAALAGDFPLVNGPVDLNNAMSLRFGYPASVFDIAKCGPELLLKRGGPEDRYIFNPAGQEIELEDLLCVYRRDAGGGWIPTGNAVKDAMATKVYEGSSGIVAVVYAPSGPEGRDLETCASAFADALREDCGAAEASWSILP